jgi:hypothetical protein
MPVKMSPNAQNDPPWPSGGRVNDLASLSNWETHQHAPNSDLIASLRVDSGSKKPTYRDLTRRTKLVKSFDPCPPERLKYRPAAPAGFTR